jgi:hypothetical protein
MHIRFLNYRDLCVLMCLLLLFLLSAKSYGQKGYSSGYIISPTNDTTQVKIKLNELDKNQCVYLDLSSKNCIGDPGKVKAFSVSVGRSFRYMKFKDSINAIDAYFEVLVEGKINLFSFRERLFVQKDNGEIHELVDTEEYGVNENGADYFRKKREYVGLLKYLLSDATTVVPEIESLDYSKTELKKVIRIYNEGETYIQELNKLKYKRNFKFGIEALFSRDNYKFWFPSDLYTDEYNGQFLLSGIGGTLKYQFSKHLLVNSGLRLKYLDFSIYKLYGVELESSKRYYALKNSIFTLSIPIIIEYQFGNQFFHPVAGFGVQFERNFLKNTTCLEESNKYSATDFYTYEHQAKFLNPINTYWTIELGGSPTIGKHSFNLKAQYLMDISILNSQIDRQFYHKSGLQLIFGLMF